MSSTSAIEGFFFQFTFYFQWFFFPIYFISFLCQQKIWFDFLELDVKNLVHVLLVVNANFIEKYEFFMRFFAKEKKIVFRRKHITPKMPVQKPWFFFLFRNPLYKISCQGYFKYFKNRAIFFFFFFLCFSYALSIIRLYLDRHDKNWDQAIVLFLIQKNKLLKTKTNFQCS